MASGSEGDSDDDSSDEETPALPAFDDAMEQYVEQQSGGASGPASPYVNCDFLYGSSAEVERLWSVAKYILIDPRKGITPQTFEALLFLKINKDYWNLELVVKAIAMARQQGRVGRAAVMQDAYSHADAGEFFDVNVEDEP